MDLSEFKEKYRRYKAEHKSLNDRIGEIKDQQRCLDIERRDIEAKIELLYNGRLQGSLVNANIDQH